LIERESLEEEKELNNNNGKRKKMNERGGIAGGIGECG